MIVHRILYRPCLDIIKFISLSIPVVIIYIVDTMLKIKLILNFPTPVHNLVSVNAILPYWFPVEGGVLFPSKDSHTPWTLMSGGPFA